MCGCAFSSCAARVEAKGVLYPVATLLPTRGTTPGQSRCGSAIDRSRALRSKRPWRRSRTFGGTELSGWTYRQAQEARLECVSVWYTFFLLCDSGVVAWRLGWGTAMDSTALHALVAEVRGTAAALAEAEQRVASFTAELAQQDRLAQPDAKPAQQIRKPIPKRGSSGWVPAG